jgi:predicted Zn-dependent peptidase
MHSKSEYEKFLNSFTDKDIIDAYHKIFDESFVGLTIMGNVQEETLNIIKDLFKFKKVKILDDNYESSLEIKSDVPFIKESDKEQTESILHVCYDIKDYKKNTKYAFSVIASMLNSTGRVMHQVLRDELGLVYTTGASFDEKIGYFTFSALIDKNNLEECLKGFDMAIERLKSRESLDKLLPLVKNKWEMDAYIRDESKWNSLTDLFVASYKTRKTFKEELKCIEKITKEDVLNALDLLEKKVVYFYEGAKE